MGKLLRFACVISLACVGITTQAAEELRIGLAGPLTGRAIFRGEQVQRGTAEAVEALNAKGGVLGRPVRLIAVDDACDADQAVAAAQKLVADEVSVVIGHVCSHASIPASRIYASAGIPMISPASTSPRLTDEGIAGVFRVCGRDDQQGKLAAEYLASVSEGRRIAIIHDGTVYGEGLAQITRSQLRARGITEAVFAEYKPGLVLYDGLVAGLKAASVDLVYIGGYPAEAGLILREAAHQGLSLEMVGGDSLTTEEFWLVAGEFGKGTRMTFGPDPRTMPSATDVVRDFRANAFEPAGYTLHAYAAVEVWAQAVAEAGSADTKAVIAALHRGDFRTVLGSIRFDDKGDPTVPGFIWYEWRGGSYRPLE